MKTTRPALRITLPCIASLLAAVPAGAWQTYPDDQDPMSPAYVSGPNYPWVFYDFRYGQPGQTQYKGVWRTPNAWPGNGATVDINIGHIVSVSNTAYVPSAGANPVTAFGGGNGQLALNGVNIQSGAAIISNLDLLTFNGGSTWSGGFISTSPPGKLRNFGDVVIAAPSTIGSGGEFINTNRITIPTSLGLQFGLQSLTNQSGTLPDPFFAEISLTQPGASIVQAAGGGGPSGYITNNGVIRKQGGGTSTISGIVLYNHADSPANRSGTIQVDSGTLVINAGTTEYWGLKAEIAPGAVLQLSGDQRMHPGTTTVTGGGILRVAAGCVLDDYSDAGSAILAAPEGELECAGGSMYDLVNTGSINVTAPSVWSNISNRGHVRQLTGLQLINPSSNGTPTDTSAIWDLEDTAGFAPYNQGPTFHNYALLRKSGPGTSLNTSTTLYVHGSNTDANAGRIEVTGGTLQFPTFVYFQNGGRIRVASGTTLQMQDRVYITGNGTLTLTGSGKVRLLPGSAFYAGDATSTGTLNAAPGTWEFNGGTVFGPANNTGEITVTATTAWGYGFLGSNTITNSGTIHCLATSAGSTNSLRITALVGMNCTPSSVLSFDIAGRPSQNTQWARMLFAGQNYFTAGGKLRINFGNFTPVSGDRWRVVDYQSGSNPPTGDFTPEFTNVPAGFVPFYEKVGSGSFIGYEVGLITAPAPQTYAQWATAQNFTTVPDAAFTADPDKDGWSNALECALGTNPKSNTSKPAPNVIRYNSGGDLFLAVQYTRPGGASRPTDVQYIAERSDTLSGWTTSGVILESGPLDGQGRETITLRLSDPFDYHSRGYLRLSVQQ